MSTDPEFFRSVLDARRFTEVVRWKDGRVYEVDYCKYPSGVVVTDATRQVADSAKYPTQSQELFA